MPDLISSRDLLTQLMKDMGYTILSVEYFCHRPFDANVYYYRIKSDNGNMDIRMRKFHILGNKVHWRDSDNKEVLISLYDPDSIDSILSFVAGFG